jgi:hypothetical protein
VLLFVTTKAQQPECPYGYVGHTIEPTGGNPPCNFKVYFCFNCGHNTVSGPFHAIITDAKKISEWCQGGTIGDAIAQAEFELKKQETINDLCGPPIGPCYTEEYYYVKVTTPLCWEKYYDEEYDDVFYRPCPQFDDLCFREWKICFNPNPPPGHFEYNLLETQKQNYDPLHTCTASEPDTQPDINNPVIGCFKICLPCTPEECDEQ